MPRTRRRPSLSDPGHTPSSSHSPAPRAQNRLRREVAQPKWEANRFELNQRSERAQGIASCFETHSASLDAVLEAWREDSVDLSMQRTIRALAFYSPLFAPHAFVTSRPSHRPIGAIYLLASVASCTSVGCSSRLASHHASARSTTESPSSAVAPGLRSKTAPIGGERREYFRRPAQFWPPLVSSHPRDRLLAGDYEVGDALLVAYDEAWSGALQLLVQAAAKDTEVYVLVPSRETSVPDAFDSWLLEAGPVHVLPIPSDSPWVRDYGPLRVRHQSQTHWIDTRYSPERPQDDAVSTRLSEVFEAASEHSAVPLDGGAIISNGHGLCAMTNSTLDVLRDTLDIEDPEQRDALLETIGCHVVARLPELPGESTGHADMIAQFLSPHQIAISVPSLSSTQPVREALRGAQYALYKAAQLQGLEVRFVPLPLEQQDATFFSYVNGLRTANRYLVPSYSQVDAEVESVAHERLARALGSIEVVPIDSDEMIESGGAVHCITLALERSAVHATPVGQTRLARPPRKRRTKASRS